MSKELREEIIEHACPDDEIKIVFLEPDCYDKTIKGLYWDNQNIPHIVYDRDMIINMHIHDGMTYDEAQEFIDYNTIRALPYMGVTAPILITPMQERISKPKRKKRK